MYQYLVKSMLDFTYKCNLDMVEKTRNIFDWRLDSEKKLTNL